MDFDEFQESDLMFSNYSYDQSVDNNNEDKTDGRKHRHYNQLPSNGSTRPTKLKNIPKIQRRIVASSAPMNIPSRDNSFRYDDDGVACFESSDEDYEDNSVDDQGLRLPPHIIVERRLSGEMARSFSPLKGRNLCEARDNIMRMTGFLER
ncbi:protein S40-2-like [Silene latifolia]|uniref:protein S40-2-like n=1 Tax=Silene latifolia TaxID=37657 RepID=UPI003D76E096